MFLSQKWNRKDIMKKGFTLIELLIVVAIIGILAAIAVPNFLNAQIRAKVSRAVSDMKTLETALEMYAIDEGEHPPANQARVPGSGDYYHPNEIRFYRLTTPVAYLSSVPKDPFVSESSPDYNHWGHAYDYVNSYDGNITGWGHEWRINSWGPDQRNGWGGQRWGSCDNGEPSGNFVYNSSNGLVSAGDIIWVGPKAGGDNYCNIQNGI